MMNFRQLAVLNSLVTFAMEQLDRHATDEETEVAQIVGKWVTAQIDPSRATKTHDYRRVNPTYYTGDGMPGIGGSIDRCLEVWSRKGWRLVAVIPARLDGEAPTFILERPVGVTHPDD